MSVTNVTKSDNDFVKIDLESSVTGNLRVSDVYRNITIFITVAQEFVQRPACAIFQVIEKKGLRLVAASGLEPLTYGL